ncbi:unnamed protein product [Bemisia tabaci]|uniref:Uncharacterized protein n=1 Tax=Bemisia tabaci TaxID=7038 RepID=A0A9P0G223_BEMTA|nr:unnamed protein product [Bemisia tabaci]
MKPTCQWKQLALILAILSALIPPNRGKGNGWPFMSLRNTNLKIQKGTLLLSGHSRLMLALDENTLVRMPWRHRSNQKYTWLIKITLPVPETSISRAYRIEPAGFDPVRAVELAKLLLGKRLPYNKAKLQTEKDWIYYICFSRPPNPLCCPWCLQNRPLTNAEIEKGFYFKDPSGNLKRASELKPLPEAIEWEWSKENWSNKFTFPPDEISD